VAISRIHNKTAKRPAPTSPGNRWRVIAAFVVLAAVAALAFFWLRNDGTVTLNVKDADVRDVVKEIARQSGQQIILAPNASGTVTLNIRKRSAAAALSAVAAQTGGMWQEYFAVAESRDSLERLRKFHREGGEAVGWQRGNFVPRDMDGHRISLGAVPDNITYSATAQPARDVALALTYRMNRETELVVADSLSEKLVTLYLDKRSQTSVVNEFAKQLEGELDHFIVMRTGVRRANVAPRTDGQPGGAPPPWMTGNRQPGPGSERANATPSATTSASIPSAPSNPPSTPAQPAVATSGTPQTQPSTAAQRPAPAQPAGASAAAAPRPRWGGGFGAGGASLTAEQQADAQREWQRHLNAMSPEQRARAEQVAARFSNIRSPQEFAQAANSYLKENPGELDRISNMINERLQATTPEQRVEAYKQFDRIRKMMEQFQQNQSAPSPAIPPPANP
jgi:hypothetical protein